MKILIDQGLADKVAEFLALPEYQRNEKIVVWGLEGVKPLGDFVAAVKGATPVADAEKAAFMHAMINVNGSTELISEAAFKVYLSKEL